MKQGNRPLVLVLEDDTSIADNISQLLINERYDVVTANSAAEAFQWVESNPNLQAIITDLVLSASDGTMAHGSGSESVRFIEDVRRLLPRVPIIAYSAFLQDRYEELSKLGISALVSKRDASPYTLLEKLREALKASEERQQAEVVESDVLINIRKVLVQEVEKYAPIKERTLLIPDEGVFELIKHLVGFKRDIERKLSQFPFRGNVFLMMKFRSSNRELADFIIESLSSSGLRGVRADAEEWNLTRNIYNPIAVLYCCKYGIALFDEPETNQPYSPNVAYELGMMHYQNKDCLILKHVTLPQVPFDLIKDLYVAYEKDLTVRKIITSWIKQIGT